MRTEEEKQAEVEAQLVDEDEKALLTCLQNVNGVQLSLCGPLAETPDPGDDPDFAFNSKRVAIPQDLATLQRYVDDPSLVVQLGDLRCSWAEAAAILPVLLAEQTKGVQPIKYY